VAYGLGEDQMRRWGLYVSNPLGPEESVTPFAGEEAHISQPPFCVSVSHGDTWPVWRGSRWTMG